MFKESDHDHDSDDVDTNSIDHWIMMTTSWHGFFTEYLILHKIKSHAKIIMNIHKII